MGEQSDQNLYRIIRTIVRAYLSTFPNRRIGEHDESDLTHSIFIRFIADDRAQLKKYDPSKGAFVGFVAMKTRFWLRTIGRKHRKRDELAQFEQFGETEPRDAAQRDIDEAVDMRLRLLAVAECVKVQLPDATERHAAHLLFERLCTDDEFLAELDVGRDRMYRLKHKLRNLARRCVEKLFPEDPDE